MGKSAEIVLRSRPTQRFRAQVARIEPESDRVNEERRVEITFDRLPDDFSLGEQAEVYVTTTRLPQALLVPEAAIEGLSRKSRNGVDSRGRAAATARGDARTSVARWSL